MSSGANLDAVRSRISGPAKCIKNAAEREWVISHGCHFYLVNHKPLLRLRTPAQVNDKAPLIRPGLRSQVGFWSSNTAMVNGKLC